jgi:D-alanine-D-alanine ligase-like ATP-grasp enzyme/acylphosphatase
MLKYNQSLQHLTSEIVANAYGSELCMYAIALEGWRRGLTLKFYNNKKINYSLSSEIQMHVFNRSRGDRVPSDTVKICINKDLTKENLMKSGIPVPEGKRFIYSGVLDIELINYANSLGFPVVLKPTSGSLGRGVISNIQSKEELEKAIQYVCHKLKQNDIIIEKYIPGNDFRLYVVGNKVVAAIKRVPANVVGDGYSSIKDLISLKNSLRRKNPFLSKGLIKIDEEVLDFINKAGYDLESVLKEDEQLFLMAKANASAGGDTIDVTDDISQEAKEIAINAAQAMPGLVQCGVDMIIDESGKFGNEGTVIEINSRAQIGIHLFPVEGESRDIPSAIIDYYFPETIDDSLTSKRSKVYFDLEHIFESFQSQLVKEITLESAPQNSIIRRRIVVAGNVQDEEFGKWIQKQAHRLNLNGYTRRLKSGNVLVIAAGKRRDIDKFKALCENGTKKSKVIEVRESKWTKPVVLGFHIK